MFSRVPELRHSRVVQGVVTVLAFMVGLPPHLLAQQTREDAIVQEQAAKAQTVHPYEPGRIEGWVRRAEHSMLLAPDGLYPWIGSVYPGGLLGAGPGVRIPFGGSGAFDAHAGWSLKNYKLGAISMTSPRLADGRLRINMHADIIDAPGHLFFGVGNDTIIANKTSFLFRPATVGASVSVMPVRAIELGGGLDYLAIDTGSGSGRVSVEERFTSGDVPGLGEDPRYVVGHAFAAVDWRESPGYTRRGGLYRVDWYNYSDRDAGNLSFRRLDAEVKQFVPILRENWVIALRGAISTTDTDAGNQVPYFLMPDLGGGSSLRGVPSWRFRDRHQLLLSAEYRWTPSEFLDMAVFTDAGKVTARRSDLDFADLHTTYGIGARFHTAAATPLRIDFARGKEGYAIIFSASQPF